MKKSILSFVFLCVTTLTLTSPLFAQDDGDVLEKLEAIAIVEQKIMVPMRDGIRLATDIYRPKDAEGQVPTIFVRTPYNFNTYRDGEPRTRNAKAAIKAVEHGYAYIVQNERGRYFSEGEWDILGTPRTDGYDALTWIAHQRGPTARSAPSGARHPPSGRWGWRPSTTLPTRPWCRMASEPASAGSAGSTSRATGTAAAPTRCSSSPGSTESRTPSVRRSPRTCRRRTSCAFQSTSISRPRCRRSTGQRHSGICRSKI